METVCSVLCAIGIVLCVNERGGVGVLVQIEGLEWNLRNFVGITHPFEHFVCPSNTQG